MQGWLLLRSIVNALWRTGRGLFGQMKLKSIDLDQMEEGGSRKRRERDSLKERCRKQ